jgi:hypothetical protein
MTVLLAFISFHLVELETLGYGEPEPYGVVKVGPKEWGFT